MKLKDILLFWIPMGFAVTNIMENDGITHVSGEITVNEPYGKETIKPTGLWTTCYEGLYLVYSPDYPKKQLTDEINKLEKQLNNLQKQLRKLSEND